MRVAVLICCILALASLALIGLSYTPGISLEVSVTDIDNGVMIRNVGNIPCLVVVSSLEGEQQFALAVGANVTVIGITKPTSVLAAGSTTGRVDLEELERMEKAHERWVKIKYNLSSNFIDPWSGQAKSFQISYFGNFRLGPNELKPKLERYSPIRLVNATPISLELREFL